MSADRATNAIRFDRKFVRSDSHASAIGTTREVDPLIVYGFVLRATETIHRLSIEQPRVPRVVEHRQRDIMMVHIVFKFLPAGEPALNQLSPYRFIECILFHDYLRWSHLSHLPFYRKQRSYTRWLEHAVQTLRNVLLDDAGVVPQNIGDRYHTDDLSILRHGQMPGRSLLHHADCVDDRPITFNGRYRSPHTGFDNSRIGI